MNKQIEKIIVDIIKHEMDLPDTYGTTERGDIIPSVIIYSQNIKLHNTDKLQITVQANNFKTYSNRTETLQKIDDKFYQIQDMNQGCMIQIDCYSRNNEARDRHHEVIQALSSIHAEELMDIYNFKLGLIGNTVNASGADGGSDINRFIITYNAIIHHHKEKEINYYDKFKLEAYNEKGKFSEISNY